jgi:hypothetical protein
MNRSSIPSGLSTLRKWHDEKGTLNFDLKFQRRAGVWNNIQKSMLVHSLLTDSYVPPVIFVKNDEDIIDDKGKPMTSYSVLDGLQRLSNLFSFMNNEYQLHGATPVAEIDGDSYEIAGLYFEELPQELQNLINAYKFTIQVIANATEDELTRLYMNINSGVALSPLQQAKPRLGNQLCEYFAGVLGNPFFTQGISLTVNQALREEDLAIALQALILLSDDDYDWKSLSVNECLRFASYLHDYFDTRLMQEFTETIEYLNVFDTKTKYLRKNNASIIIKLAEEMLLIEIEPEAYKAFLDEFFANLDERYKEHSGVGNVKKVNVYARYEIMRTACYKYFRLSPVKNSDANDAAASSDEPANAEEAFAG